MSEKLNKIRKVYEFEELTKYSLKERWIIRLADLAFYFLIGIIGKTLRFEVEGWENFEEIERAGRIPIYTFWHNRIFTATYFFRDRGIVVMTSQSLDGEYIARFIQRFGYGASRGSSTRGGIKALGELIRLMRSGLPAAFTIDGPKGPKYVAKPGAGLLAKKSQNPIMPFSIETKEFWEVRTWDDLQIPKPFSRARVFISKPIYIPADADNNELENKHAELQNALDELVRRGVQWRQSEKN